MHITYYTVQELHNYIHPITFVHICTHYNIYSVNENGQVTVCVLCGPPVCGDVYLFEIGEPTTQPICTSVVVMVMSICN